LVVRFTGEQMKDTVSIGRDIVRGIYTVNLGGVIVTTRGGSSSTILATPINPDW
jgi:hypothetical protein